MSRPSSGTNPLEEGSLPPPPRQKRDYKGGSRALEAHLGREWPSPGCPLAEPSNPGAPARQSGPSWPPRGGGGERSWLGCLPAELRELDRAPQTLRGSVSESVTGGGRTPSAGRPVKVPSALPSQAEGPWPLQGLSPLRPQLSHTNSFGKFLFAGTEKPKSLGL